MPLFEYQGRDKGGQKVYGRVDARTDTDARRLLKFMGISDAKVKGAGTKSSMGTLTLPPALEKFFQKKPFLILI